MHNLLISDKIGVDSIGVNRTFFETKSGKFVEVTQCEENDFSGSLMAAAKPSPMLYKGPQIPISPTNGGAELS